MPSAFTVVDTCSHPSSYPNAPGVPAPAKREILPQEWNWASNRHGDQGRPWIRQQLRIQFYQNENYGVGKSKSFNRLLSCNILFFVPHDVWRGFYRHWESFCRQRLLQRKCHRDYEWKQRAWFWQVKANGWGNDAVFRDRSWRRQCHHDLKGNFWTFGSLRKIKFLVEILLKLMNFGAISPVLSTFLKIRTRFSGTGSAMDNVSWNGGMIFGEIGRNDLWHVNNWNVELRKQLYRIFTTFWNSK